MDSQFITIEGIEGAGKSTALRFIHTYLQKRQIRFMTTREPGGTEIAEEIRKVLLYPASSETMQAPTELLLMFAGRAQHIAACIQPALKSGKWVVSDRYIDASYAYQGGGRGIPLATIEVLDKMVVNGVYPNLTLLLDVPPEVGFARTNERGTPKDRIEQEQLAFFVRVREVYLQRAQAEPNRIKLIDASKPQTQVQAQITAMLDEFMQT